MLLFRSAPATLLIAMTLCPLALAATAPQAPANTEQATRSELHERSREQERALALRVPTSEQRSLQGQDEEFLALWLPALSPASQGTVIVLPGYGAHADHPSMAGWLRQKLPGAGWNSLSISLPDPLAIPARSIAANPATPASPVPTPAANEATPATEQGTRQPAEQAQAVHSEDSPQALAIDEQTTPDNDELRNAHAERIYARLDAALAFAAEQSGPVVLVGNDSGAYWAARYAAERKPATLQRLALISLRAPNARTQADTIEPQAMLPTADFFYRNRADEQAAALPRLQASQRAKHSHYRQIALQAIPADPQVEREQLFRRLRGWLSPSTP